MITTVMAVAKPWTYWMAPPILAAAFLLIIGMAVGYYRKIAVPGFHWEMYRAQHCQRSDGAQATIHQLRSTPARAAGKAA